MTVPLYKNRVNKNSSSLIGSRTMFRSLVRRTGSCKRPMFLRSTTNVVDSSVVAMMRERSAQTAAKMDWRTVDPEKMSSEHPAICENLCNGEFVKKMGVMNEYQGCVDPMMDDSRGGFLLVPRTSSAELEMFVKAMDENVSKSGLHNPFKNVERYLKYGDVTMRLAEEMRKEGTVDFFARLIQRVAPKSYAQARAEVVVTRKFLENFAGDNVRFLSRGFSVPGDHYGQQSNGYRWPYGKVAIITPFNFPLEIPVLQLMGALYMGNRVLLHVDSRVSIVMDQFVRLMLHCGAPKMDVDVIHCDKEIMGEALDRIKPRMTLFTGSQKVADELAIKLKGKVKLEDAGFDWKILGPDAKKSELNFVAYQCDQDAYACSGQKCSAQSILFAHENWCDIGILDEIARLAKQRNLKDLTVGPVLSKTTAQMLDHTNLILKKIKGSSVLFGGKALLNHRIPKVYGAIEPTAVKVPLSEMLKSKENFDLVTTEIFGPFQIVVEYNDSTIADVLEACERMENHLTAAIVSNDVDFRRKIIANTVNGTTYVGSRARTTGAPQNHWFGPAGDPRAGGIGTKEAIQLVWSTHREIIVDDNSSSFFSNGDDNEEQVLYVQS